MRTLILFVLGAIALPLLADDRKEILRAIRDYQDQGTGSIPQIAPYLDDRDPEVRWEAVKAIAELGTARSIEPLIKATSDSSPEIQIRAIEGLVNFYLPGYLKSGFSGAWNRASNSLKGRFTDTNTDIIDPGVTVQPEVITALGRVAATSPAMESRAAAARGIGVLRGQPALDDLYQALRTKNGTVLYESVIAIQKIRDVSAGPMIQFLLRDLEDRVQIAVVETTGILRNREALPVLRDVLENDKEIKVRRAALTAIAMMPDPANRPLYTRFFSDSDDGLRAAAAEGYARLKTPSDLPAIEKAFQEERKMGPRLSMAFACVALGRSQISEFSPLQYLVNTLNSRSYRDSAEPLLTELARDPAVRRSLYPVASNPNATREEKIRLARIFGATGDAEALPVLERLKADTDVEVSQEGARAARNLATRL